MLHNSVLFLLLFSFYFVFCLSLKFTHTCFELLTTCKFNIECNNNKNKIADSYFIEIREVKREREREREKEREKYLISMLQVAVLLQPAKHLNGIFFLAGSHLICSLFFLA